MFVRCLVLILLSFAAISCAETPTVLVLFGATGDLTTKKILPAIDQLKAGGYLPKRFALVGVARKAEEEFRKQITFNQPLYYSQTNFEGGYEDLANRLAEIDRGFGAKSNRIYFLAAQPSYYSTIVEKLSQYDLIDSQSRIMIEKPFGHDLASALQLQANLSQLLDESQIYRIDHYLGKEGVQNLIDFRLRGDLESRWNHQHIDHIAITLSEEIGIGNRANLWEETGLLRDVVQNHIVQLLSLTAMEMGDDLSLDKVKVLQAAHPFEEVIRGQYGPGTIQGKKVVGYKEEKGVPASSQVETFISATLFIDNERWKGVPFTILSGKRLAAQLAEIAVTFKSGEVLHIRIQPNPDIFFENDSSLFSQKRPLDGYQELIYDCIHRNQISFVQKEEPFAAWRLLEPALNRESSVIPYEAGSWGPELNRDKVLRQVDRFQE